MRVFLSYASEDRRIVDNLYERLSGLEGITLWQDKKELLPGHNWQREITKAVRSADVVIVCLSRTSVTKVGFVHKEIKLALDEADLQPEGTIFLIPLKLEECEVPERLRELQWVNYFEPDGYTHLIRALQARANTIRANTTPQDGLRSQTDQHSHQSSQYDDSNVVPGKTRGSPPVITRLSDIRQVLIVMLLSFIVMTVSIIIILEVLSNTKPTEATDGVSPTPTFLSGPPQKQYSIPGRIEAEDYRAGGKNIGYYDSEEDNQGRTYRNEGVDIEPCGDDPPCHSVGWIRNHEWLSYSVTVAVSRTYVLQVRLSEGIKTRDESYKGQLLSFEFEPVVGGDSIRTMVIVPKSCGEKRWRTLIGGPVTIPSGNYILKVVPEDQGFFNLNWFSFTEEGQEPLPDADVCSPSLPAPQP